MKQLKIGVRRFDSNLLAGKGVHAGDGVVQARERAIRVG